MKHPSLIKTLGLGCLTLLPLLLHASGGASTLTNTDASGSTSFNAKGNWNGGLAPGPGTNFYTSTFGVRTPPDALNYTFAGDSLTLQAGTTSGYSMLEKSSAGSGSARTLTINNLTNAAGALFRSGGTVGSLITITGNVFSVSGNSTILADQCNWIINSPVVGSGILTNNFASSQTLTFGGNNSAFAGKLLINGIALFSTQGAVPGNPAAALPDQIILGGGGTLRDNIGITLNNANAGVTLYGNATINTVNATTNTTIAEPITGAYTLSKSGAGTLTLSGSNGMTGLTLTAGQLNINSTNALGTGAFTVSSAAVTLDNTSGSPLTNLANNAQTWGTNFTFNGSASLNLGTGAVTLSGTNRTVTVNSNTLTLGGGIGGTFALTKAGSGTLALTASNSFAGGSTLTAGTLVMGNPYALGTNGLTFSGTANATLDLATDGADFTNAINAGSTTIWTIASDVKTGSVGINHTLGAFAIGSGSALQMNVIQGSNVLSGTPQITTGPMTLSGGSGGTTILDPTTASLLIPSVTATATSKTLQLDGTNPGNAITGVLGQGAEVVTVVKANTSTWTLGGASTYTGPTTVSNGTLIVTGSIGSNTVTVVGGTLAFSGGGTLSNGTPVVLGNPGVLDVSAASGFALGSASTLSGAGVVNGSFADSAGSQFFPGGNGTVGTLTFNNNLTLAGGDTWNFDFSNGSNDTVLVNGGLNPSGTTVINLVGGANALTNGTYVLFQVTGAISGGAANFTVTGAPSPSRQTFAVVVNPGTSPKTVALQVGGVVGNLVWQGGLNGNLWDVTTTYNWLNGGNSDVFFGGDNVNFTDAGILHQPVLNTTVLPGSVTFNASGDYNLTGTGGITGSTSLTKSGTGTLTIGTVNNYTGVTTLGGGTVSVSDLANSGVASSLGAATAAAGNLVFNGGTLQYTGPTASTDHGATVGAGGGTIALGSSGITLTLNGSLVGTSGGALTKTGNDTLILNAANTYNGATLIGGGTLQVGNGGATGSLGTGNIANNGALVFSNTATLTLSNAISGTGSLTQNDTGLVVLAATNSFTGGLLVNTGTVEAVFGGGFGGTPAVFNPNQITLNAGTLEAIGTFSINDTNTGINDVAGTIAVAAGNTLTMANQLTSANVLIKSLPGTLVLSGSNNLSGTLDIDTASATGSDGAVDIASTNALSQITTINIRNNQIPGSSTLQLDGTAGSQTLAQTFTWSGRNNFVPALENLAGSNVWNPSSVTFNVGGTFYPIQCDSGTLYLAGTFPTTAPVATRNVVCSGAGNIALTGSLQSGGCTNLCLLVTNNGTVTLWSGNSYSGLTSVQGGTINAADGSSFGTSTANIELAPYSGETATLNLSNASLTAQRVIIAGVSSNTTAPGTATLNQSSGSISASQWFTVGSGGITGGTGTYNNTGGTLSLQNTAGGSQMEIANFAGSVGTVNLSGGGQINLMNNAYLSFGANANAGNGTINQSGGSVTFYGSSGGVGGTGLLYLGKAAGLTNTYAYHLNGGTLTVPEILSASGVSLFYFNGGTLTAAETNATLLTNLTAAYVSTGGAVIDDGGYPVTIPQALVHDPALGTTADGGLTKQDNGVLTLSGTNTYTGATVVNSGSLWINGSLGIGAVTVSGGTLGGAGVLNGAVDVQSGVFAPGASFGVLTVSNKLSFEGGVTAQFNFGTGTNSSAVVTGALNVNGTTTVNINFINAVTAVGTYPLIQYGSLSGFANLTTPVSPNPRFNFSLVNNTATKIIQLVVSGNPASLVWHGDGSANGWDNTGGYENWLNTGKADYFYDGDTATFTDAGSSTPSINLTARISPSSVTVTSTQNYDFAGSGLIAGPGGLTKNGSGTLTLEDNNTYVGTTLINAGTVQVGAGASTGSLGTGVITNNASLVFDLSDAFTLASPIYGTGSVTLEGGTVTASGSNYYTGATLVNSGLTFLANAAGLGATNGGISVASGAQLYITANVNVGANPLTITGTGDGNGALRKGGAGATTYSGAVALGGDTTISVDTGATLTLASTNGINGVPANATLTLAGAGAGTLDGPVSLGTGGLNVTAGTWTLGASNNFTGLTTVSGGTLGIVDGTLGNPGTFNPAQITFSGGNLVAVTNVTFDDGLAGLTLTANTTFTVDAGATLNISNNISGASTLTKASSGTLILSGSNAFTGVLNLDSGSTSANDGITRIASPLALANIPVTPGTATIAQRNNNSGYSTLQLDGSNGSLNVAQEISMDCRNTANAGLENVDGSNTISGNIEVETGGGNLYFQSDSGTLNLAGSVQYLGTLAGGRIYNFTGAGNHLVSGVITSGVNTNAPISVTMSGTGTLTLAGANTYGYTTTVASGTLLVAGSINSSNGVTATGGVLGGTGVINDNVTVQAGGTLFPGPGGSTLGTLTLNSNLTLAGTVSVNVSKTAHATDAVTGVLNLTYGGTLSVTNLAGTLVLGDQFKLFSAVSAAGNFTHLVGSPGAGLAYSFNATSGVLSVVTGLAPNPTNLTVNVTGTSLAISWPADHVGWILQSQTNTLGAGLGTNWVDITGSSAGTTNNFTISPVNPTVFFRLRHP